MLLCYGGINQILLVTYSDRYLGIVGFIYCCMLCLFASVSTSFLIVIKYSVVAGAANVRRFTVAIKYCSEDSVLLLEYDKSICFRNMFINLFHS